MKRGFTAAELKSEIAALEIRKSRQEEALKSSIAATMNSLKPMNLIKSTFNSAVKSQGFGKNVLKGAAGLAAGFLSKRLFFGGAPGIIKKALGTVVELGVAKVVANNAEKLAAGGKKIIAKATS